MISIIICSRTATLSKELTLNISKTIGVDHELIVIDNSQNQYCICDAYNLGVKQSKYDILCFMHDDITYHSQNWGKNVVTHFTDIQVDAIGVAGTPYCAYMPGPWWGNDILYEHLLQGDEQNADAQLKSNGEPDKKRQATILDGVWLCIRKPLFNTIGFDDINFKGFHFYDADICMQIHQVGGKLWCVNNVFFPIAPRSQATKDRVESIVSINLMLLKLVTSIIQSLLLSQWI